MSLDLSKIVNNITINNKPVVIYNKEDTFSPLILPVKKISDPENRLGKWVYYNDFGNCYNLEEIYFGDEMYDIWDYGFQNCVNLKKITLTCSSAITIASSAFRGCARLKELLIPNALALNVGGFNYNEGAFDDTQLEYLYAPKVERIGGTRGFYGTALSSIVLPECSSLGEGIFQRTKISEVTEDNFPKLKHIGRECFAECFNLQTVTTDATTIASGAFLNCTNLKTIQIPNISTLSQSVFYGCISLEEVSLPAITSIDGSCFAGCTKLKNVYIPNCMYLGGDAFARCSSLESINLPLCTSFSNMNTFSGCYNLSQISLPLLQSVTTQAFAYCYALEDVYLPMCEYVGYNGFLYCGATTVDLPICLSVGSQAFTGCTSLTNVNLPNCTFIDQSAFKDCKKLSQINLQNCSEIAYNAFMSCSSLEKLILPNCSKIYGTSVFYSCSKLSALVLGYSDVITFGSNTSTYIASAFVGTPMRTSSYLGYYGSIYVPASLVESYITIWGNIFSSRITSIENWTGGGIDG